MGVDMQFSTAAAGRANSTKPFSAFQRLAMAAVLGIGTMLASTGDAQLIRIKDITTVDGVRTNTLTGVGLVDGLDQTGGTSPLTRELMLNFLQRAGHQRADALIRMGIRRDTQQNTSNLAVVTVTAELPTFVRQGQKIDVVVSLFEGESLEGGNLLQTALVAADKQVYATASGPIALGGFSAKGQGASVKSNHRARGHIVGGASVEREVPFTPGVGGTVKLLLRNTDFATAHRIATAINEQFEGSARALDARTVDVIVPQYWRLNVVGFVSEIQALRVEPDNEARVTIDENTGTIVIGHNVRIANVAINHGNLTVITAETPQVSQPNGFSRGVTAITPQTDLQVTQERSPIAVVDATTTVGDLAAALNALAVSPRDLSSIFRQLNANGAIYGDVTFK